MQGKTSANIQFALLMVALMTPNIGLTITDEISLWGKVTNIILPLGAYVILATATQKIGKTTLWCFPLFFFAAFQLVLLSLFGGGVIAVDMFLNMFTTNSREAGELLGSMAVSFISIIVYYLIVLAGGVIAVCKKILLSVSFIKNFRKIGYALTGIGLISIIVSYLSSPAYSALNDLYPVNVFYNFCLAIDRSVKSVRQPQTSASYTYSPAITHITDEREIYILVVGETSRASSWNLAGYERNTTPRLSSRDDILFATDAMSESNTTHKSVPLLLSPLTADEYNDDIYKVKSLISAFKEAGFKTAFLSNQLPNKSLIDEFGYEADTTLFVRLGRNLGNVFDDRLLLSPLDGILNEKNRRQLIVCHAYGSHFNYTDRYLRDEAVFLPDDFKDTSAESRDRLVNAYDNTILMTDDFLNSVIDRLDMENCVSALIYTSDHGEDIYEDGHSFLHASPRPSYQQLHVPILAWMSEEYVSAYPEIKTDLEMNFNKPISSTRTFCPTSFGIAGINTDKVSDSDNLASKNYKFSERVYLNDHNEAVAISSYGIPD